MSNKRNRRRRKQRVRAEVSRKPNVVTKARATVISAPRLAAGREAKERERNHRKIVSYLDGTGTRSERKRLEKQLGQRQRVLGRPRKIRKPRTKYGRTFWNHSHDA